MATQTTVHAHKYHHFEDLQLSARAFYRAVQEMISEYQYDGVTCGVATLSESGMFSSRREYMRVSKGRYHFYVCASPFGRSFFVSWWLQEDAHTAANLASRIPWLGRAIAARMESKTYYELDTQLMFTSSINSILSSAVERLKVDRGFREDVLSLGE
jgi:hypothetical protein